MASSTKFNLRTRPSLKNLLARNQKRAGSLKKLEKPHGRIAVLLDRWVQTNFRTEGKNVGGWAPFARGGRRLKDGSIDTSAKLLQDTGRLRSSFLPFHSKRDAGIGSDLPYAKDHDEGLGKRLPQRRLLPKTNEVFKDIKEIYDNFIDENLRVEGEER